MKTHRIELWALLFVCAFFSAAAQAQSVFRLYAGVAPTIYRLQFDDNNPSVTKQGKTVKSQYTAANVGLSWISARGIYVDLSAQKSLSATHDLWSNYGGGPQDFSHDVYTLTAGYSHAFSGGTSVSGFGGLIKGTTTLAAPKGLFVPALGGNVGWSEDKFETKGVFVGVGGGIPALGGQVSVSGALAFMKGRWTDDLSLDNSADTTVGYSLGTAYTYKFTQAWGVTADLRYQQYNYNFAVNTITPYDIKEKVLSAGVRLSYQF